MESETWTQLDEFPGSSRRFSSAFAIGNKGYIGIGTTGTNMRDFWEFDELLGAEETVSENIRLYPNPATDFTYLQGISQAEIHIYDLAGKLLTVVYTDESNMIDLSTFESGTYLIEIRTANSRTTSTFIIQ